MNTTLQRFHRYAMSRLVWPLSIFLGFAIALGWQIAPDSFWKKLLGPLTSAVAVGGAFLSLERAIRLKLWRIAYPEYDFSGTWSGGTQYNHQECCNPLPQSRFRPFEKKHSIKFNQDCLSVSVDYDETEAFIGWNSTVATIVEEAGVIGLRYAYTVRYKMIAGCAPLLPESANGLEEVFVVKQNKGQIPTKITGSFAHTIDGPGPYYRGTVSFERILIPRKKEWYMPLLSLFVEKWLKPPAEQ